MYRASLIRNISIVPQTEQDKFRRFVHQHGDRIQQDILDRAYENQKDLTYVRDISLKKVTSKDKTLDPHTYFLTSESQIELFQSLLKSFGYSSEVRDYGSFRTFTITWREG